MSSVAWVVEILTKLQGLHCLTSVQVDCIELLLSALYETIKSPMKYGLWIHKYSFHVWIHNRNLSCVSFEFIYLNSCTEFICIWFHMYMNSHTWIHIWIHINYEFIWCFMNSYMNLGVPRFQMVGATEPMGSRKHWSPDCQLLAGPAGPGPRRPALDFQHQLALNGSAGTAALDRPAGGPERASTAKQPVYWTSNEVSESSGSVHPGLHLSL